jgi:hypothetical protein
LRWLEEFDSALESNDVSSLVPIYETLLNYDPSLANEKWFTQLGDAGTSIAQKMMTAGDAAETLGGKFLDVTAALEAAAGRMLTLASEARASTAMTGWKQTVSQVNSSSRSLNAPASLTAAKTDTGYKISQFPGKLNLPKLAEGGKVTQGGLAWIGEAGPEIVIPEDDLKGLYPQSANVDKGSMRWFEDYPYRINSPASYQWSKYPAEPNVVVTGDEPRAWLSEGQPTGMDYIKSELNEVIAKSIGNSMVKPWFAGGYEAQPDWWTEAATAKSPKYADTWAEPKGGEVPDIPDQTTVKLDATQRALTVKDVWDSVYGESFTEGCIAANSPDESLMFTPSNKAVSEAASGWGKEAVVAWNYLYGESFTEGCIATNKTDKLLKFSPSSRLLAEMARTQGMSTVIGTSGGMAAATPGGWLSGKTTTSTGTDLSDALVVPGGNTASDALTRRTSWNAIYDNKGTCIAFVEPDPSMNFTPGKDYLPGGKGLGNMGGGYTSLGDQEIATWDSVANSTQDTATATEQVVENTRQLSMQTQRVADGLVVATGYGGYGGGGGGSGIIGLANRGGGTYWGGTSISGGGAWIASSPGPASGSRAAGWMNTGARAVGGSNAIQWAEGGFADQATFGVFGESGREAFVPISDRAAGLRILPRVMQELGVATFAQGGIVGPGGRSSPIGGVSLNYAPTIQGSGLSEGQLKRMLKESADDALRKAEKLFYKERK